MCTYEGACAREQPPAPNNTTNNPGFVASQHRLAGAYGVANGFDILLGLAAMAVGLEVVLYVLRGSLLRIHQTERLERQAKDAQTELQQLKERSAARQAELTTVRDQAETALAMMRKASRDLADSQRPREVLIHRLGEPGAGTLFRAALRKTLPDTPEENQTLFWSYENFVDVWASSPVRAEEIAARHFAAKAGYSVGAFQPVVATPTAASASEAA